MNDQAANILKLRRFEERTKLDANPKIISVCSGKGGTGKTFFSTNFATQLARLHKKVLVVDLDYNFSNIHILLNEASKKPVADFFLQKYPLHELIVKNSENLHFIFGSSGISDNPRITIEMLEYLFIHLKKLSESYDYVLLDSAAGADELTLFQLCNSGSNIVIASPEPTAVMDAYMVMKMISENTSSVKSYVVINKAEGKEDGEHAFHNLNTAVRHFLGNEITMLGIIGYDRNVYRSIVDQQLLLETYPNSIAALEINELAHRFLKFTQVANNNHHRPSFRF